MHVHNFGRPVVPLALLHSISLSLSQANDSLMQDYQPPSQPAETLGRLIWLFLACLNDQTQAMLRTYTKVQLKARSILTDTLDHLQDTTKRIPTKIPLQTPVYSTHTGMRFQWSHVFASTLVFFSEAETFLLHGNHLQPQIRVLAQPSQCPALPKCAEQQGNVQEFHVNIHFSI